MSLFVQLLGIFCFLLIYGDTAPTPGCTLSTNKDLPKKNEPLLLIRGEGNTYRLAMPTVKGKESNIELRKDEEILMACPGSRNFMNETNQPLNHFRCKSGNILALDRKEYESGLLDCHGRAEASIRNTENKCHSGKGTLLEMGFKSQGWYPLVTVCHDIAASHSFYSKHTLYGALISGKVYRSTGRPGFSRGEKFLFNGFKPDDAYNKKNQKRILDGLFGEQLSNEYLDSKNKFMSRGHLAPDADFLFSPWQLLTYFYINVAPQWQSINAGNWLNIENNSRKIATKLGADLEVTTGTHGVLRIKEKTKPMYLESNSRVPVPEYFWKILRNPKDNSCMGFISTNNPFLDKAPKHKCQDVCSKYGWPVMQNDLFKGYVYCCEYGNMKDVIPELPQLKCNQVLKY